MFSTVSHPYAVQLAALWFSFLPEFVVALLLIGAQVERLRRRIRPREIAGRPLMRIERCCS